MRTTEPLCEPPGARDKPEKAKLTLGRLHAMFGIHFLRATILCLMI